MAPPEAVTLIVKVYEARVKLAESATHTYFVELRDADVKESIEGAV